MLTYCKEAGMQHADKCTECTKSGLFANYEQGTCLYGQRSAKRNWILEMGIVFFLIKGGTNKETL